MSKESLAIPSALERFNLFFGITTVEPDIVCSDNNEFEYENHYTSLDDEFDSTHIQSMYQSLNPNRLERRSFKTFVIGVKNWVVQTFTWVFEKFKSYTRPIPQQGEYRRLDSQRGLNTSVVSEQIDSV